MLKSERLLQHPQGRFLLYADRALAHTQTVSDFGLEWTELDPYRDLESLSYSHLFARFLLPQRFFEGKAVLDLGCGNGRLADQLIAHTRSYVGVELSEAIFAFDVAAPHAQKVTLVRASMEDVPLHDGVFDVVLCWGVLHHVRDPDAGFRELRRLVKPGGVILLFIYPDAYAPRENLNRLFRHVPDDAFRDFCAWYFKTIRQWGEADLHLASSICNALSAGLKLDSRWELLQMFDGLGPAYHHLLEGRVGSAFPAPWRVQRRHFGCYYIERAPEPHK